MKRAGLIRNAILATLLVLGFTGALQAQAKTLRWSHQQTLSTLDPMAAEDAFTQGFQSWFYEALTGFDQDMKLAPMLAESWSNPEPNKWVFHLRRGVSFHDGSPFTADDVIYSWQRSQAQGSTIRHIGATATEVARIDDHTVEVTTARPNPVLPRVWAQLYIMSKSWAANKAGPGIGKYAGAHENGTGPFAIIRHAPGGATTLKRYDNYWDQNMRSNITDVRFQPIAQGAERMAALVSGEMDVIMPVPFSSLPQLEESRDIRIMARHRASVWFIITDQRRNRLPHSSITEKNPLKDKRVRQAISLAIDTRAINQQVMNGLAKPTGTIISPQVNGYDMSLGAPHASNIDRAKKLLLDAGYPEHFSIRLACPNGHYVNDHHVCEAIVQMLDRVGIRATVAEQDDTPDTSLSAPEAGLYLLDWAPKSLDAAEVLFTLVACRDDDSGAGKLNLGGYCNKEIDALAARIATETDQVRRNIMIKEAFSMLRNSYSFLPLHQSPLLWGVRQGIRLEQRADGVLDIRSVVIP